MRCSQVSIEGSILSTCNQRYNKKAAADQMDAIIRCRLWTARSKVNFCILGFLFACLANEQSVQIGGIDRSREAAAVCIGHSKGIRRVAELFQRNDLPKKLVLQKVVPTSSILNI